MAPHTAAGGTQREGCIFPNTPDFKILSAQDAEAAGANYHRSLLTQQAPSVAGEMALGCRSLTEAQGACSPTHLHTHALGGQGAGTA